MTNGTVTDSQQVLDQGTDFTVGYEPNENYELRKIYVDGEKQNILEYPTEYTSRTFRTIIRLISFIRKYRNFQWLQKLREVE